MANIANNEISITFQKDTSTEQKQALVSFLLEHVIYEEYNEVPEEDFEFNCLELSYGTKWSERREDLQKACDLFDVKIIGVCWEWGCGYVTSFELSKN